MAFQDAFRRNNNEIRYHESKISLSAQGLKLFFPLLLPGTSNELDAGQ